MKSVCVYCGSSAGNDPAYLEAARQLAAVLAQRGLRLVYGGASVGLMGAVADTALAHGGEVVGVIPQVLVDREVAHPGLTELHTVADMHERKARMAELSDAFVALPGGIGTLEELIEVYTWSYLGIHDKPLGLVNTNGYYDGLTTFLDHSVTEGFLRPETRAGLKVAADPETLLDELVRGRT
ncbi:TIGR00730 family Rossman fold protein [Solirubrobacter sp. CPCC 204708]|uniref:Cytokinin riboside 5'-monophosphate phosphoribohydrolase n=1 Tax=Solirubrobacter deserti TaxID=2282478 RepID=A0ABT4RNR2_9ACTN|nr:TIGR00730 family Rossman fold protein [Solirubrobacter deserti]MBE2314931.1 TIGR00730 family Rossman fold protein [Solirubrobacter deserti]MDA0140162.1 TIGR00730 family Rossman fold protein [Solirubrobacter deserti]